MTRRPLTLVFCALWLGLGGSALSAGPQVMRAQDFTDSIGVNLHLRYTDGGYAKTEEVVKALRYLGIRHVRDAAIGATMQQQTVQAYDRLGGAGMTFTMLMGGDIAGQLKDVRAFEEKFPGAVHAIEGPNEVNNWPVSYGGKTGVAGAVAYQEALYDAVKADATLGKVPVFNYTNWPPSAGKADFVNLHPYPKKGDQPFAVLQGERAGMTALMPGKPAVITETGYYTLPKPGAGWGGVDELTQAKFMLNLYLDAALLDIKETYVYQLLDAYPDKTGKDQETHFGLFDLSYRPKAAATAIRTLNLLLSDTDPSARSFAPRPLSVTIGGLPASAKTLKLQKADGTSVLAIWNEPDIWDETTATPIAAAPKTIDVKLGAPRDWISAYAPVTGPAPVASAANSAQLTLPLTDEPLLVMIAPEK